MTELKKTALNTIEDSLSGEKHLQVQALVVTQSFEIRYKL